MDCPVPRRSRDAMPSDGTGTDACRCAYVRVAELWPLLSNIKALDERFAGILVYSQVCSSKKALIQKGPKAARRVVPPGCLPSMIYAGRYTSGFRCVGLCFRTTQERRSAKLWFRSFRSVRAKRGARS